MILQGIVFLTCVIIIDTYMINSFKGEDLNQQTQQAPLLNEMQDVVEHRNFSDSVWENGPEYLVQGKKLRKVYNNGNAAVSENTWSVKQGEVFGLLGPNGAGKSTMFNIMTMDLKRTSGNVKIMGQELD